MSGNIAAHVPSLRADADATFHSSEAIPNWAPVTGKPSEANAEETNPDHQAGSPLRSTSTEFHDPRAFKVAVAASAFVFGTSIILGKILEWVGTRLIHNRTTGFAFVVFSLAISDMVLVVGIRSFAVRRAGFGTKTLGLRRPHSMKDALVLAVVTWFGFLLVAGLWVSVTEPSLRPSTQSSRSSAAQRDGSASPADGTTASDTSKADLREPDHAFLRALRKGLQTRVVVVLLISICFVAPILEELFFRGFLYRSVAARFGSPLGMIVSGLVFGAAHLQVVTLSHTVPIAIMGIALAWLYEQTGSLLPGIAVHAFVNSLSSGIAAGFGGATLWLIVGSWLAIAAVLLPWMKKSGRTPLPRSLSPRIS